MLDFQIDDAQLNQFRDRLSAAALARAARRAGNDGLAEAKRAAVAYVRTKKRVRESTIERRLDVVQPGNRASLANLRWGIRVSPRPISLGSYPSTQTPQGVVAEVNVGSTFLLRHAFIRVVRNGFRGVFERQGPGAPRYPLKSLVGSGVRDVLSDPEAGDVIQQTFGLATAAAFARYAQIELDRNSAGG
jgi:hypothetical protein